MAKTAVDTNVLLDIVNRDPQHYLTSKQKLRAAIESEDSVVAEPVYAELSHYFATVAELDLYLRAALVRTDPSSRASLHLAGKRWRQYTQRRGDALYCAACGKALRPKCPACGASLRSRQHILADFLIGAHALVQADQLLTRDRGFYKRYFPELHLIA